jgi:hypothetical protein
VLDGSPFKNVLSDLAHCATREAIEGAAAWSIMSAYHYSKAAARRQLPVATRVSS